MFVEKSLVTVALTSEYVVCRLYAVRSRRTSYTRNNRPGAFSSLAMALRKVATGVAPAAANPARGRTFIVAVSTISEETDERKSDDRVERTPYLTDCREGIPT